MRFFLLFLLTFSCFLKAEILEEKTLIFEQIKNLPKGLKRDFYINEFLKLDYTTPKQAFETLSLIDNMNMPLFHNFAKKFKNDETLAVSQCLEAPTKELVYSYADCIAVGLDIKEISTLSTYDLKLVLQNLDNRYPKLIKKVKILSSAIPFTKLIISDVDTFYDIFFNVTTEFRRDYFNYKIPSKTLNRIKSNKAMYNKLIQTIITDEKLTNLQQHLEDINLEELDANTKFLLCLYNIKKNDLNKAYELLENLEANYAYLYKEKLEFFKYFITKDSSILENITSMQKLNIYSFYANEILENSIIQPTLNTLEYIDKYENLSKENKALLYSTIKVNSDFSEDKISSDFRLGLTQLSLNNIKKIEKYLNKSQSLIKQFEAQTNIEYFLSYLDSLKQEKINPFNTFIKYNYNKSPQDFDENLDKIIKFEFLSFLFEDFDKYFVNYYLYYNSLQEDKEKIKASSLFQML
ncbi:MAG: hypothetical protein ACNI25_05630 [Halarcobacter sp.]